MEGTGETRKIFISHRDDCCLVIHGCVHELRQERNVVFWSNIVSGVVCPGFESAYQSLGLKQCSPIDAEVDRSALVARSEKTFSRLIRAADSILIVRIIQNDMMKPQAGVGICICPIWIFEPSLHVGDGAIRAPESDGLVLEVSHPIVDIHWRNHKWAISDFDSLGALVGEESRRQCSNG